MTQEILFLVQGSEQEPYEVTFRKEGASLTADCTCQAAMNGMHCKHRLNILRGERKNIVSENKREVDTVLLWVKGTELESLIRKVSETEETLERTKKDLANIKKKLSKVLQGGG